MQIDADPQLRELGTNLVMLCEQRVDLACILLAQQRQQLLLLERHVPAEAIVECGPQPERVIASICLKRVEQGIEELVQLLVLARQQCADPVRRSPFRFRHLVLPSDVPGSKFGADGVARGLARGAPSSTPRRRAKLAAAGVETQKTRPFRHALTVGEKSDAARSPPLAAVQPAGKLLASDALMSELTVERFMTHCPHTIGHDQPLSAAHEMMRRYQIRHLPVLIGDKLVGMLSQRDLHFIETLSDVDAEKVPVSDAMSTDTYAVGPRSSLRKVAAEMADHRYGSVVVVDKERVIGIMTTVDGMRALSLQLAERRFEESAPR